MNDPLFIGVVIVTVILLVLYVGGWIVTSASTRDALTTAYADKVYDSGRLASVREGE